MRLSKGFGIQCCKDYLPQTSISKCGSLGFRPPIPLPRLPVAVKARGILLVSNWDVYNFQTQARSRPSLPVKRLSLLHRDPPVNPFQFVVCTRSWPKFLSESNSFPVLPPKKTNPRILPYWHHVLPEIPPFIFFKSLSSVHWRNPPKFSNVLYLKTKALG